jgi:hypothetical protein
MNIQEKWNTLLVCGLCDYCGEVIYSPDILILPFKNKPMLAHKNCRVLKDKTRKPRSHNSRWWRKKNKEFRDLSIFAPN